MVGFVHVNLESFFFQLYHPAAEEILKDLVILSVCAMMDANGKGKELLKACIYVYYTHFKNKITRKGKKNVKSIILYIILYI